MRLTHPLFHRMLAQTRSVCPSVPKTSAAGQDPRLEDQRFAGLVQDGYVDNLIAVAIRCVIGKVEVSTMLIGIPAMEQLEQAVVYSAEGPLPAEALERLVFTDAEVVCMM